MFNKLALTIFLTLCKVIYTTMKSIEQNENIQDLVIDEGLIFLTDTKDFIEFVMEEGSGDLQKLEDITDTDNCVEFGYTEICSGHGQCSNNKCKCNTLEFFDKQDNITIFYRYSGIYCEECPYCKGQRCHNYLPCLECNILEKEQNCASFCTFNFSISDQISRNVESDEKICDIEDSNGCYVKFKYFFDENNFVTVEYERKIFCMDVMIFTFWGVVAYVFALFLLVPKLCFSTRFVNISHSHSDEIFRRNYNVRDDLL